MKKIILLFFAMALFNVTQAHAKIIKMEASSSLKIDPMKIGEMISGLKLVKDALNDVVDNLTGDMKNVGTDLLGKSNQTINELQNKFQNQLNESFETLSRQERKMFEDGLTLTNQLTSFLQKADIGLSKKIYETDILAYNSLYSLPGRSQYPRVVYSEPSQIIAKAQNILVTLRGNFLDFNNSNISINLKVNDKLVSPSSIKSIEANQIIFLIEDTLIQNIKCNDIISIKLRPNYYKKGLFCKRVKKGKEIQSSIKVIPRNQFSISGTITPYVYQEDKASDWFSNERHAYNGHDQDVETFYVPEDGKWKIYQITFDAVSQGGSGRYQVNSQSDKQFTGKLDASPSDDDNYIRGKWHYYAREYKQKDGQTRKFSDNSFADEKSTFMFDFDTDHNMPDKWLKDNLIWKYNFKIIVVSCNSQKVITITNDNTNDQQNNVTSYINLATGQLTITILPD